jgi:hypothetical protein
LLRDPVLGGPVILYRATRFARSFFVPSNSLKQSLARLPEQKKLSNKLLSPGKV